MKKATASTVRFTINFIKKQIIGTKASFDKASKGSGPIYEELAEKVAKHPDFALIVKEQKKHTTKAKKTYYGMDFDFMEALHLHPKERQAVAIVCLLKVDI